MMYSKELEFIFLKLDGLEFQYFFNALMSFGIPNFCPVRQRNDGGNDGFVQSTGTFYQVYAPESITRSTIKDATSKMIEDFDKLAKNWHYLIKLQEYVFVFNDKFKGVDESIIKRIEQLKKDRTLHVTILTANNLIDIFHSELSLTQQKILIDRYSIAITSDSAISLAAKEISNRLPISKWKALDEKLSFFSFDDSELKVLSEISSSLFSMIFSEIEQKIVDELIDKINGLVNLFYSSHTTERNGERVWDNSWKRIPNNPRASFYDEELKKWESNVQESSIELCKNLNVFAKYVREHKIPDFLGYKNHTITRRINGSLNEFIEFIP